MNDPLIIQGNRVVLRPPQNEDFAFLSGLRNDLSLQRQVFLMSKTGRHTSAQVRAWICRRMHDSRGVFLVVARAGHAVLYNSRKSIVAEARPTWEFALRERYAAKAWRRRLWSYWRALRGGSCAAKSFCCACCVSIVARLRFITRWGSRKWSYCGDITSMARVGVMWCEWRKG